jgi:FecR protein
MARSTPFLLNSSGMLLALISAGFAGGAGAAAGRVDFVLGGVTVAARDGQARPLVRGAEVDAGDIVRTNNGRAQIRFADGAYVSLQPESEFNITEYRFDGKADGSERGFFGLLKGAMRTVTGAIGRSNRNAYRLTTPTATVGIRGTGGVIQVLPDGSTLVIGTSGTWFVTNPAGTLDVPAGTSVLAPADPKAPPRESATQPTSGPMPLPPEPPLFEQGEQVSDIGTPLGLVPPLVSGPGYAAALGWSFFGSSTVDGVSGGTATFDPDGQMTGLSSTAGDYVLLKGSHAQFGTDGLLAWGRWIGEVSVPADGQLSDVYSKDQGLHYVIGLPTSVMPATGTATYSLLGATSPTYVDGKTLPGTFSGSLNVDFGAATVGLNLKIAMPDSNGYLLGGSAEILRPGSLFSGDTSSSQGSSLVTITPTDQRACICSATVQGFFSGLSAERAGLSYNIQDSAAGAIVGAAAFKK